MFYLKIVKIALILLGWSPRTTYRVNKVTILKRFTHNLLKDNINFEVTWWDGVGLVIWTIINWSHWIYNVTVRKATYNNPNFLGLTRVYISHFHSGLSWDKHIKLWHAIFECKIRSSIFMKQHSRECIIFKVGVINIQVWIMWRSTSRRSSSCSKW